MKFEQSDMFYSKNETEGLIIEQAFFKGLELNVRLELSISSHFSAENLFY